MYVWSCTTFGLDPRMWTWRPVRQYHSPLKWLLLFHNELDMITQELGIKSVSGKTKETGSHVGLGHGNNIGAFFLWKACNLLTKLQAFEPLLSFIFFPSDYYSLTKCWLVFCNEIQMKKVLAPGPDLEMPLSFSFSLGGNKLEIKGMGRIWGDRLINRWTRIKRNRKIHRWIREIQTGSRRKGKGENVSEKAQDPGGHSQRMKWGGVAMGNYVCTCCRKRPGRLGGTHAPQ